MTEEIKKETKQVEAVVKVVETEEITEKKVFKKRKRSKFKKRKINRHLKCLLCEGRTPFTISYSDVSTLKKFMSVRGNIISRIKSGMCAKHQRALRRAVERARHLALLPYVETGQ